MKSKGMLFKSEMVRAILDGSKTQTRRIASLGLVADDQIWVRETFYVESEDGAIFYKADRESDELLQMLKIQGERNCSWKPSLFMPKAFSRITLKLIDVKKQWLRDMTEADAVAEGFKSLGSFVGYWDAIHSKHFERQWVSNPTVFVYTFEKLESV